MSVIEAEFHLFQVQHELTARDAIVPLQLCLGIAPEILDAGDVPAAGGNPLPMSDPGSVESPR